jgi:two-component system chemotaxis response regulator CheY
MKILIIDDNRAMRMLVRRAVRQAGLGSHDYVEAASGEEALVALAREDPDVVLCDWNMPGMTGLGVLTNKDPESKAVFGFVTSESTTEMRQAARMAGARFFISKPFTPEAFHAALREIIL